MADRAVEEFERRQTWFRLAVELGQKEDFLALIEAERRDAVETFKAKWDGDPRP